MSEAKVRPQTSQDGEITWKPSSLVPAGAIPFQLLGILMKILLKKENYKTPAFVGKGSR